jgi:lysozyme
MKISEKGLSIIKKYEGLKLSAYKCPAGVWTIGFGHTKTAKKGMVITYEQAIELLKSDVIYAENTVSKTQIILTQNQFDALVSFVFNVGYDNFLKSTLLKLVKKDVFNPAISHQFCRWVYGGGKVLPGLVKRRKDEAKLYFS